MEIQNFFLIPSHAIFITIIFGIPALILYTKQCKKDYEGFEYWGWDDWVFIWATPIAAAALLILSAAESMAIAVGVAFAFSLLSLLAPSQTWKLRLHQFIVIGLVLSLYYIEVFWW